MSYLFKSVFEPPPPDGLWLQAMCPALPPKTAPGAPIITTHPCLAPQNRPWLTAIRPLPPPSKTDPSSLISATRSLPMHQPLKPPLANGNATPVLPHKTAPGSLQHAPCPLNHYWLPATRLLPPPPKVALAICNVRSRPSPKNCPLFGSLKLLL